MASNKKPDAGEQAQTTKPDKPGAFKVKEWHIEWVPTAKITPYEKNARINDQTIPYLINAIRRFGFKVPLVIDARNIIVCGHTRLKAAESIGLKKLPCVRASDLTDAELKAFRLADNKIQELSEWNFGMLVEELKRLGQDFDGQMVDFGFAENGAEFDPDAMFDDENASKKEAKPKHYRVTCPGCNREIIIEG